MTEIEKLALGWSSGLKAAKDLLAHTTTNRSSFEPCPSWSWWAALAYVLVHLDKMERSKL